MAHSQLQGIFWSRPAPSKVVPRLSSVTVAQKRCNVHFWVLFNMLNVDIVLVGRKGSHPLCPVRSLNKMLTRKQSKNVCKVHLLLLSKSQTLGRIILGLISSLLKGWIPQNGRQWCKSLLSPRGLAANYFAWVNLWLPFSKEGDHTRPTLLTGLFGGFKMRWRTTLWSVKWEPCSFLRKRVCV